MSLLEMARQIAKDTLAGVSVVASDIVNKAQGLASAQSTGTSEGSKQGLSTAKELFQQYKVPATIAGAAAVGTVAIAASRQKKKKAPKKAPKKQKVITPKKKAPKKKKKSKGGSHRKMEPHKHKGGKDDVHKRKSGELIHFTKRGQPFIIDDKTGRAKFIKKSAAGVK